MNSKINYRADIDGLRAVAVLSVVLYHVGINFFSGGYIGVDVFFVISGFLITTIIVREIESNEFSLLRFYERRIRRIYPALYIVIAFVLLMAYFLYDPSNFKQTSKSMIATVGFMSNILFWTESGYFNAPSTLKPLLHTWSLAVEEQFYILFPLLILFIVRFARKWLKLLLGLIAFISFLLSIYFLNRDASAVFYFVQFRAWELLIGGLLAINTSPVKMGMNSRNLWSSVGLAMILYSLVAFTESTPFPAANALLPTVGAALIIYCGMDGNSLVGKFLSLPPLVFTGKISYSLYLWHWPIIIFASYYLIQEPTPMQKLALVVISFIFASLSWAFIENPFRLRSFLPSPKIFIFGGSVMVLALLASGIVYLGNGLKTRFQDQQFLISEDLNSMKMENRGCNETDLTNLEASNRCKLGHDAMQPTFLLWGDSHARALSPAIDASAKANNVTGYLMNRSACAPIADVYPVGDKRCSNFTHGVLEFIEAHAELDTIILAGRWALSANGTRYGMEEGTQVVLVDKLSSAPRGSNAIIFENGLDRTVRKLLDLNRNVVIVSSVPEVGFDVPSSNFIAAHTGRDINKIIAPTHDQYIERNLAAWGVLTKMKDKYGVLIVNPADMLCDKNICRVATDQQPLYQDSHHLSTFGSLYIASLFDPIFGK